MEKRNKSLAALGILISLLVLVIFVESIIFRNELKSLITTEAEGYGYLFIAIISAVLEFFPQFIAPTILMLNAAVLGLSLPLTTLFIILGSTIGAVFGFFIGRRYGRQFTNHTFGIKKVKKVENLLNSYGKWFVAIAALTPLPYVPIIFGALGMKTRFMTIFGFIPRAISYIILWLVIEFGIYSL